MASKNKTYEFKRFGLNIHIVAVAWVVNKLNYSGAN
jgi:hypothetical protein